VRICTLAPFLALVTAVPLVVACTRAAAPDEIALAYGRALYAYDAAAIQRLASAGDRRAKDTKTIAAQLDAPRGFALETMRQLASFVTGSTVDHRIAGLHATVTVAFRLPDANAAAIKSLARDWDEPRLDALSDTQRAEVRRRLDELHRSHRLPVVEGRETFRLVKEDSGWRLLLDWAGAMPVRFTVLTAAGIPLETSVSPAEVRAKPGESFRVTVRARNLSGHEVTARVEHRIAPEADARFLALLQCPLFLPATFKPGEAKEFTSAYLVLEDMPERIRDFAVTYMFGHERGAG
jgi:hypothetical protein